MNCRSIICAVLALVLVAYCSAVSGADKLDARVAYSLKKIVAALDKAEKLLDQGDPDNAEASLDTAQTEWDAIHRDFKGQFDVNHPDIVATKKRLEALGARLKTAVAEKAEEGPAPPPEDPSDAAPKAPPAAMAYVLKQIHANLEAAEERAEAKDLKQAKVSLEEAEKLWTAQQEWNVGKYDPRHPDIVALVAKLNRVRASVGGLGGQAAAAAAELPAVLAAITESSQKLAVAHQEARQSFRGIASLLRDYEIGREDDVEKLRLEVERLRWRAERVNELLPDAHAAAKAFRQQFPDFEELGKLVRDGRQASQAVERLEQFPVDWLEEVSRLVNLALGMAEGNIRQYGLDELRTLEGDDKNLKTIAADRADNWVVEHAAFLLEIIPSVMPELPKNAQPLLPQFATARAGFLERSAPMLNDIKRVSETIGRIRQEVVNAERRRLERARFPKSEYHGGQWDAAEAQIRTAWAKAITDKPLLKVDIYSPWEVRTEARWRNGRWVVGTYRYIGAHCLAKLPSGKYMVYRMSFRNTKQPGGGWSELAHWSVGHVYEILQENIDS